MTFKGTARIGSVNVKKEELLLDSLDEGGYTPLCTCSICNGSAMSRVILRAPVKTQYVQLTGRAGHRRSAATV